MFFFVTDIYQNQRCKYRMQSKLGNIYYHSLKLPNFLNVREFKISKLTF